MTDLIKRLESAEAGSRELDVKILCAVIPNHVPTFNGNGVFGPVQDKPYSLPKMAQPVTTDLSAAVALVERVLPDCNWQVHKHGFAGISLKGHGGMYVGVSSDCVLSLCLALLQALKAKEHV
jgi:hypothetical protein